MRRHQRAQARHHREDALLALDHASLVLAALFFAGIHLGIAGTRLRDRAIAALGQGGYIAAFSIASVAGLVWMVIAYRGAPYVATWGMLEWWKPVAIVLMLPAVLLVVIGLATPNPTSVAQEDRLTQAGARASCG